MSKPRNEPVKRFADSATPTAPMCLSGIVRTSGGFAVARVVLRPDGTVESFDLGPSQAQREYVAMLHKRLVVRDALNA
jgi:hypothetical protein